MREKKRDYKLLSAILFLVVFMSLPSLANLAHAIYGHHENQCTSEAALHFDETEFDCEFQKFKLSKEFYPKLVGYEFDIANIKEDSKKGTYQFLSSFQQLHFSLRGPPTLWTSIPNS